MAEQWKEGDVVQLKSGSPRAECGGPLLSVRSWRQADELGKPQGRRG
jgi:hypothetical protein